MWDLIKEIYYLKIAIYKYVLVFMIFLFTFIDPPGQMSRLGLKKMKSYAAKKARNTCTTSTLLQRFPGVNWARNYNLDCFIGDLIAGLTTALTVIPQGIGYAPLAGLPLQVSYSIYFLIYAKLQFRYRRLYIYIQ